MQLFYFALILITILFIIALLYRKNETFDPIKDAEYTNASWVMNAIYN